MPSSGHGGELVLTVPARLAAPAQLAVGVGGTAREEVMKVLIIGAGAQGHVVTWNLARCPEITRIVLGDR